MSDTVELIRDKTDLVDYVSRHVNLKKAGKNLMGLCPFHKESTPSFSVSPERQVWHCFGCRRGGDLFTFVQEKEGLDFKDALAILAREAGVEIKPSNNHREPADQIFNALNSANEYFQRVLNSQIGQPALDYLTNKRQLTPEIIRLFKIGYAPNSWNQTGIHLLSSGFSIKDLADAGLIITKSNNEWYDRFRNRVVFPIHNRIGQIVGFSGRTLSNDKQQAKYLNSPETRVFKKSKTLYGLHLSQEAIRKKNYVIMVEGHLDVVSLHKIGIRNVVAPQGTAVTAQQLQLLKYLANRILVVFDNDKAGMSATLKAIQIALEQGFEIKVAQCSNAKDTDEAVRENPKQLISDLKNSLDFFSYLIKIGHGEHNSQKTITPEQASKVANFVLPFINSISDSVYQESLLQQLSQILKVSSPTLVNQMRKLPRYVPDLNQKHQDHESNLTKTKTTREQNLWQELTAMLLQLPDELNHDAQLIALTKEIPAVVNNGPTNNLCLKIVEHINNQGKINTKELNAKLSEEEKRLADLLIVKNLGKIAESLELFLKNLEQVINDLKIILTKSQITQISADQELEQEAKVKKLRELTAKLKDLQILRDNLKPQDQH